MPERPLRAAVLLGTAAALGYAGLRAAGHPRRGHRYFAGAPLLMAHRGGAALAPENTLLAFRRAIEWWNADVIELDVRASADDEIFVIHDATVDRTTDGSGAVSGLSATRLRQLDAGFRFTPRGGSGTPSRGTGIGIPTLREVLAGFPDTRINLEIKDGRAQRGVGALVHEFGASHRVLIAAGRRANRSRFGDYAGPVSASAHELRTAYAMHLLHAAALHLPPVDALQMPERYGGRPVLNPRLIRDAHARNIAVHVWTVDNEPDIRRLLGWGVDGLVTDRPDRLARVLHERVGRPLPPGPPSAG